MGPWGAVALPRLGRCAAGSGRGGDQFHDGLQSAAGTLGAGRRWETSAVGEIFGKSMCKPGININTAIYIILSYVYIYIYMK